MLYIDISYYAMYNIVIVINSYRHSQYIHGNGAINMKKKHQTPDVANDSLFIINAIKSINISQKENILNKIEAIKLIPNDFEINSSSNISQESLAE